MNQRKNTRQPRIFSAVNWGYATLPLMGLALPDHVFARAADEFSFDAAAPEPTLDLVDILPQMVRHFGSTQHHMGHPDLQVGQDGSAWVAPPDVADTPDHAHADDAVDLSMQPVDDAQG